MSGEMKAAVYKGLQNLQVETVPILDVGPNDVLVNVNHCGICGSDLHSYKLGAYIQPGAIMGHEFVGIAHAVGKNVKGVREGDRVTGFAIGACGSCEWCRTGDVILCPELFHNSTGYGRPGAFSEYVRIENAVIGETVHQVPEGVDDVSGATVEPVAVGVAAVDAAGVKPGDKVVVLGAGMIGNACMQAARNAGAEVVAVIEVAQLRLDAARRMGADLVFDATTGDPLEWVKENIGMSRYHFHEGGSADVVIETAGAPATVEQSFEIVKSGGTIAFVGLPEKPAQLDVTKIVHKQPRIVGSLGGDFAQALELLNQGRIRSAELVSHHYPLASVQEAFEQQLKATEAIKVMVDCQS